MKWMGLKQILLAGSFLVLIALAACSPTGDQDNIGSGNATDVVNPAAVQAAIEQLSEEMNVSVQDIQVMSYEQVEWPDACLGVPQEGQACAQVVTPGFRVVLSVNGQEYELRTDQTGTVIVQAPEA